MQPIKTANSNLVYRGSPPDIVDLPCERAEIHGGLQDGGTAIYSVWELTDEEREQIARGGNVKLGVFTEPIPPVSLEVVVEEAIT